MWNQLVRDVLKSPLGRAVRRKVRPLISRQLILITGCQRSGTTLLLLMMGGHSRICGLDETEIWYRLPRVRRMLPDAVMGRITCRKLPTHSGALDAFERHYRHAEIIWMVRNPLAVVSSMRRLGAETEDGNWLANNAEGELRQLSRTHSDVLDGIANLSQARVGARIWRLNCESIAEAKRRGLNTTVVRFEDLMADPEAELKRITERVGLAYEDDMLRFHERDVNQGRVLAGGTRADRELDPSRSAPDVCLTDEEQEAVIAESMPYIEEYSYL